MTDTADPPFFTIGHSNRSVAALAGLLREAGVRHVADIRKFPMSRANPQFNADTLAAALSGFGIGWQHIAALGGLRGKGKALPDDINGFWSNRSFHNYADYALSAPFREGLEQLKQAGRSQPVAIMCAEAVWWRCHRRIVADYLIAGGRAVFHIMGPARIEPARLTAGAVVGPGESVTYPAPPS